MSKAKINGIELEYEMTGSGEPLLLVATGPIADSFHPFRRDRGLTRRYRTISYRQRPARGVGFEEHAADAAALLRHLDLPRAHVAGHSTGAAIALQLAADQPALVHSLALLEPPLTSAPGAGAFFEKAGPALAAFAAGERETAMALFLSVVSGLDWETARAALGEQVPGGVAHALKDADNFFAGYLPALQRWQFGPTQAATITRPMLSVLGTKTDPWFADSHALLHQWFPQLEDCVIDGVGHLLHLQRPEPVLSGVAAWLARYPLSAGVP